MRFRFLSTAMRETMLLIFFCGVFLCAIRHMAFAGRVLYDWNQPGDSGHSWSGWRWVIDPYNRNPEEAEWQKLDGGMGCGDWRPRMMQKNDYAEQTGGREMDAYVVSDQRAPCTSEGGCFKVQCVAGDPVYVQYWMWYDAPGLEITNERDDRFDFWIYLSGTGGNQDNPTQPYNFHLGTYNQPKDETDCRPNSHFYHWFFFNPGAWIHVLADQHPSHWTGQNGNESPHNDQYYLWSGYHYIDTLSQWYMEYIGSGAQPGAYFLIDEVKFWSTKDSYEPNQNDDSICSVWVGYWPSDDHWEISWQDASFYDGKSDYTNSTFEVKWSTSPITNENWDQAEYIVPERYAVKGCPGTIRKTNPYSTLCWTRFKLPDEIEENYNHIYFAIKDVSKTGEHKGSFPYQHGDGHDTPSGYIHTIDYYLRPDPGTGNRPPTAPRNLSVE